MHSIETFGTHEGPGIRLVIFLQGCNIRCLYCHNPDLFDLKSGKEMKIGEIIEMAKNEKEYFSDNGGITVSGGEPTLQAAEVYKLFKEARRIGINTALDTNGTIINNQIKKLYRETDFLLLDVKHIDEKWHKRLTGVSNKNVLEMAKFREELGKSMWLRYVLVPGWNDSEGFLNKWGEYFKNYKTVERVEILPYHTLGVYKYKELGMEYKISNVPSPDKKTISRAENIFKKYFKNVIVK